MLQSEDFGNWEGAGNGISMEYSLRNACALCFLIKTFDRIKDISVWHWMIYNMIVLLQNTTISKILANSDVSTFPCVSPSEAHTPPSNTSDLNHTDMLLTATI